MNLAVLQSWASIKVLMLYDVRAHDGDHRQSPLMFVAAIQIICGQMSLHLLETRILPCDSIESSLSVQYKLPTYHPDSCRILGPQLAENCQ